MEKQRKTSGITLIALVITIIVLLILAGVTIMTLTGENGLLTKTITAKEEYKIAQAREKLVVALTGAHIEKKINPEYNKEEFLNNYIKSNVEDSKIEGDIAIVEGYAFSLDRSVPKIGEYIGKEQELNFPEVSLQKQLAQDNKSITIHITAIEEKNGIDKIEIIQEDDILKTYTYNHKKDQIQEEYVVKQNGEYIIKAYSGKVNKTAKIVVSELTTIIEYSPNGNKNYQKEHNVQISIQRENLNQIKNMKYQWTDTTIEPTEDVFTENCSNNQIITKNSVTGEWYLWILIENIDGSKKIERSEAFKFDNEAPEISITVEPVNLTELRVKAVGRDDKTRISKYVFQVGDNFSKEISSQEENYDLLVSGLTTDYYNCTVICYDELGNYATSSVVQGRTQMYSWKVYNTEEKTTYEQYKEPDKKQVYTRGAWFLPTSSHSFDTNTGKYTFRISGDASVQEVGWCCSLTLQAHVGKTMTDIEMYEVVKVTPDGGDNMNLIDYYTWASKVVTTRQKSTYLKEVLSKTEQTYKNNEVNDDNLWYERNGEK